MTWFGLCWVELTTELNAEAEAGVARVVRAASVAAMDLATFLPVDDAAAVGGMKAGRAARFIACEAFPGDRQDGLERKKGR